MGVEVDSLRQQITENEDKGIQENGIDKVGRAWGEREGRRREMDICREGIQENGIDNVGRAWGEREGRRREMDICREGIRKRKERIE